MFDPKQHAYNSSLRENIVEHDFIARTLKALWSAGIVDTEILRSEFDGYGYDLILSKGDIVRHIQLKSGLRLQGPISASRSLAERPSGCVLVIRINDRLDLIDFYFFGGKAGEPLPATEGFRTSKRVTANAQGQRPIRSNHIDIPKASFVRIETLEELLSTLLSIEIPQS